VTPEDDASISDETALFRRIHPQFHLHWDDNRGCWRVTSGAFDHEEMSVALGDTLEELGRSPETLLDPYPDQYLVSLPARAAREQEQAILRDPDDAEPAHGLVVGRKTLRRKKALLAAARWIRSPEGACPEPGGGA
jgi:hypothetical protein